MSRAEKWTLSAVLVGAGILLVVGWRLFWFLTDDAFIAFRYVSNSILGHGYVWNPEPFRPVEGYTSFLWVFVLDAIWRIGGLDPPRVANVVSLAFAALTLLLGAAMLLRMRWRPDLEGHRVLFVALVLIGTTTNRTFLAWSSSGFETAMFNFLVLGWVFVCLVGRFDRTRDVLKLTTAAACAALTRPDGLLYVGTTLCILGLRWHRNRARAATRSLLFGCLPLVVVLAHLGWRRSMYGEWLPNTYYAKFAGLWPQSGIRYALSFIVEYALWVWLVLMLFVGLQRARNPATTGGADDSDSRADASRPLVVGLCLGTVGVHVLYYTFAIGGDHFEYRPYSHLVLPVFVSFVWLLNRSRLGIRRALGALGIFVFLSWPLPWTHWMLTRNLDTREQTRAMRVAVAPHWPVPVRAYARVFDELQDWLIGHWVCVRHQEHKVNQRYLTTLYPSRAEGERLAADGFPVHAFQAVGVASWTLPHVNIIDLLGLNDYVIARSPVDPNRFRGMAHEREAPAGYAACFAPNVFLGAEGSVKIVERDEPMTAAKIRACESSWIEKVP